jgi:hypothetical protein
MIQTGLQWYITKWQFVNNGASRDSVFQSLIGTPEWSDVLYNIAAYSGFVLADGLLVRTYTPHACAPNLSHLINRYGDVSLYGIVHFG